MPGEYDAFISFRGEDCRKSFTSHLYEALVQKGIDTFRDDNKLKKGNSIGPELLSAIEQSTFAVIVFSKNYADSKWCLDELVHIVECKEKKGCGPKALPVFYHVEPSEVRNQTGDFGKAFDTLIEKNFKDNVDKVNKWRKALKDVGSLSGWDLKDKTESEVIQELANEILKALDDRSFNFNKGLIGMGSRVEKMKSYLDLNLIRQDDVRTIGIWGMGGIGKTTLAEEVYKEIRHQFEASAFIANVGEKSRNVNGLVDLQKELHASLLACDAKIPSADMGIQILSRKLRNKRVLIILDNVDELKQTEALAAEIRLGRGSRVIITTRDKQTLKTFEVPEDNIYEIEKLNDDDAFQLFCQKAFKKNHAPDDHIELSKGFVKYASGLPLALRVLGSGLCTKKVHEWSNALDRLYQYPNKDIFCVLQRSYDGLSDTEKKIFLDIACFFIGEDQYRVTKILESSGFYPGLGISVLIDKCLLKIEGNKLWMCDLLQQMGWLIVRQESPKDPGKRSRLCFNENGREYERSKSWLHYEDPLTVLKNNLGTNAVEGIFVSLLAKEEIHLNADPFSKMSNLRLLKICNVKFSGCLEHLSLSQNLRILEWHECPLESLPSSFQPNHLIVLKMPNSRIKQLWINERLCLMKMLSVMDLSNCHDLTKSPDFSKVPNLEELILDGCENLPELHPTIGDLQHLVLLSLKGCESVESLPHISSLKSLKIFILSGCTKLREFPEIEGNMELLSELHLDGTAITVLPVSISQRLSGLKVLKVN